MWALTSRSGPWWRLRSRTSTPSQESRNRKVLDLLSSKVGPALHASNSLRMVLGGHRAPLAVRAAL